jgi:hypothetical protein
MKKGPSIEIKFMYTGHLIIWLISGLGLGPGHLIISFQLMSKASK